MSQVEEVEELEVNEWGLERMTTALLLREVFSEFTAAYASCITLFMLSRHVLASPDQLTPDQLIKLALALLKKHGAHLYSSQSEGGASLTAYLRIHIVSILTDVESLLRDDLDMTPYGQLAEKDKIPAAGIEKMIMNIESFIENSSDEEIDDLNVFFKFVEAVDNLLTEFQEWIKIYLEDREMIGAEEHVAQAPTIWILISLLEKYGVPFLDSKAADPEGDVAFMFDHIDQIAVDAETVYRQVTGLVAYEELPEDQKLWCGMQKTRLPQEESDDSGTDED